MEAPVAPWVLTGESIVALVRCPDRDEPLPAGLQRLPGPSLLIAAAYSATPAGAYLEFGVGCMARLGSRVGWCFSTMVVDRAEARVGGRTNWGFPKDLGRLSWSLDGDERVLRWHDRGITVRGVPGRVVLPMLVPVRALQRRTDGPVFVPGRLRGLGRLASVHVDVPDADALHRLAGVHRGVNVRGMRFVVQPARQTVGRATLRAPLRAPEPALSLPTPGV